MNGTRHSYFKSPCVVIFLVISRNRYRIYNIWTGLLNMRVYTRYILMGPLVRCTFGTGYWFFHVRALQ